MPWLVGILAGVVGEIIKFFLKFVTKKVAISLSWIATFVVLLAAFVAVLETLIASLTYIAPEQLSTAASWVIPSNFSLCLGVIITAKVCRYVWDITMHKLDLFYLGSWG